MKTIKLGSLITISKGKKHTVSEEPSPQSIRMLGIDDLRNDTLIRMTDDKDGVLACDDDVLIAWDGANAGTIGYGKRGYIGSTISRLRLRDTSKFYAPFIGMFLQSNFSYLRKTATGATIPHINRDALERIPIPVFAYDDQIRIATLLSKVENLISRRREQLKQLDELLKSVFLEMFGDPVRNEKGWEVRPLSSIFSVKHGYAFKSDFFVESGNFVLLTPGNFFENGGFRDRGERQKYFNGEFPKEYILNKNDLLLAMTEQAPGLLGSPLLVPETGRYLHNQRLGLICGKEEIQVKYLFHFFNHKSIRQIIHSKATGTNVTSRLNCRIKV